MDLFQLFTKTVIMGQKDTAHRIMQKPEKNRKLRPVVQSIVSLTSSLRGQLVKCLTTL